MYQVQTLNHISPKGLEHLGANLFALDNEGSKPDGILVRSADMHNMELGPQLLAVARAGAGTNNIPVADCSQRGIVVFNTPGANANAVKELVLAGLVLSGRKIAQGIAWAQTLTAQTEPVAKLVEKGKKQFVGPELAGKKLGVIGLGAIGVKVANMATHLGMEVLGYDPYISIDAAWNLSRSVKHCVNLSDLVNQCDFITLHIPATADTKGMVNAKLISQMKHGVRILNFARGELVNNVDLISALKSGRVGAYVCDFPCEELLGVEGCVCLPHLGASTPESEENCAVMAAQELSDYLLDGNIRNSVNFPSVSMPRGEGNRICVIHKNVPGMLAAITDVANKAGLNIENMTNKSRGDYAYTMLDVTGLVPDEVGSGLLALPDIIRVRVL